VKVIGEHLQEASEDSLLAPMLEAAVHGGRCSITRGQILPWCSGAQDPDDSVKHSAGISPRAAGAGEQFFDGDELHNIIPLMVGIHTMRLYNLEIIKSSWELV
jgi:hypothetical protein